MKSYLVKKTFNNNAVLVSLGQNEYILIGKGIGFNKKKGSILLESNLIENVFIQVDETNKNQYEHLLETTDEKIVRIVEEIVSMAEKELGETLHVNIHFGLIDHINFALSRIREGIEIVNPFLLETRMLYKKEFAIAEKAVEILKEQMNIEIPESEIGFITFHIHGGRMGGKKSDSLSYVKAISQVVPYIEDKLGLTLEENSFDSVRLVSHLRGLIERCVKNETIENLLLDKMKKDFPFEYKISENIGLLLKKNIGIVVPENEIGYIALHLYKLNHSKK
ncbi:MAG TPA: PRD domain-containing protein [Proteiniclasticum sp.]|jgi:transcriptional antiterminator|uniref:Transcriptional antiterminator, BglG family n=1 Tax=Proteiniclasticum ruminis TaxID=398199 RepID=A0A1I5CSU8_9CLOT|nr:MULTISPECIES: PRD domain-containing protein [Proteiniclasticum]SFN90014.1 transcriptional antiterminator, BglG family [Proteiniclasticum ruminis]HBW12987.1 PRD domain-containing protein [Proteiniclasticum sp.]